MGNNTSSRYQNAKRTGILQLSDLKLTKLPEDIRSLYNLRVLDLSLNKLHQLEPWIGALNNLKLLKLNGNKLTHLPNEVGRLGKLETLIVSNNNVTHLALGGGVEIFSALVNLRTVDLSSNALKEFPLELCTKSIPLDILDLSRNLIEIVPSCVEALQAIELNLNENRIGALPDSLARCGRLKVLRLSNNRLKLEDIPKSILEDSNISLLAVEGNPLSMKALQELPSYEKYMQRYTATKRKAMP